MVNFGRVIMAYFVIGMVMFGGGAVGFQGTGVGKFFVDTNSAGQVTPADGPSSNANGIGAQLGNLVDSFIGGILVVWNLAVGLIGFLNWPIIVLTKVNAPPIAVMLLGGTFTVAFYVSIIKLIRSSA